MEFILGLIVGVLLCHVFTPEEVVKTVNRWCKAIFERLDNWISGPRTDNQDSSDP